MNHILSTHFYHIEPSKEGLLEYLETLPSHEDQTFMWGNKCISEKRRLSFDNTLMSYLNDNIVSFFDQVGLSRELSLSINFLEVWENKYKIGNFQEVHDHVDGLTNLSCVVFFDDWIENSSTLYFQKYIAEADHFWRTNLLHSSYFMNPKRGDVLLFPSHMLHGVTPHREDTIRKTVSINMQVQSN